MNTVNKHTFHDDPETRRLEAFEGKFYYLVEDCSKSIIRTKYKCRFCQAEYALPDAMLKHLQLHTGSKSYRCEICGVTFMRYDSLEAHMENVHPLKFEWKN